MSPPGSGFVRRGRLFNTFPEADDAPVAVFPNLFEVSAQHPWPDEVSPRIHNQSAEHVVDLSLLDELRSS